MSALRLVPRFLAAAVLTAAGGHARADAGDTAEMRLALDAALEQVGQLETEVSRLRQANGALARSLAAANEDARNARSELQRLRTDLEALGIAVFDPTDREARRRLVEAMADLRRETEARERAEQQLLQFSESLVLLLERLPEMDPAVRATLEGEIRAADALLAGQDAGPDGAARRATVPLTAARVVSINRDLGLVVLDVGERSGVRLGMPLEMHRGDRVLGAGFVADVRDRVCGVVAGDPPFDLQALRIGDGARPSLQ